MLKNWKTTLLGVAVLVGTAAGAVTSPPKSETDISKTVAGVSAGVGLILGKDHDK